MMRIISTTLLFLIISFSAIAQFSFSKSDYLQDSENGSFIPIGVADMNGDYRDDIVRLINGVELNIDIQVTGAQTMYNKYILNTQGGRAWTLNLGDFNNDYINDFLTSGFYNGAFIYSNSGNTIEYALMQETGDDFYAQGSNLVDINNDGFLDVFICNDDGLSKIYLNNDKGELVDRSDYIDMVTVPASDNSGNYGSVWTDVDGDMDMDLYISKCRIGVESFDDPRRINALFINENGNYVEKADDYGIAIGAQSWSADFGDIDNDGDLDLYLGNHDFRHQLFENIENDTFIEIENFAGDEIVSVVYQSYFEDLDNDGYLDVIIAGNDNYVLRNNGDKTFEMRTEDFGPDVFLSCSSGDINSDGFVDLIASYYGGFNDNKVSDGLFLNDGNDNNFLSVALRGVLSNTNGVGAVLKLYLGGEEQTRVCKSGISYSITKSLIQRFGLGNYNNIDSLLIHWPSGEIDKYEDLKVNTHFLAIENSCLQELNNLSIEGDLKICSGDSVLLSIDSEQNIDWGAGVVSAEYAIQSEGLYFGTTGDGDCKNFSNTVFVEDIEGELPTISLDRDIDICLGDTILVETDYPGDLLWSNGQAGPSATFNSTGPVWLTTDGNCGSFTTDTFNVMVLDPFIDDYYELIDDSISLDLFAPGNNVHWYSDLDLQNEVAIGNDFTTGIITSDTSFYVQNYEVPSSPVFEGGAEISQIDPDNKYSALLTNGGMVFNVDKPMVLNSVAVETETLGKRKIQLTKLGVLIDERIAEITESGVSRIQLDFEIDEPGEYILGTDIAFNEEELGSKNSQFARLETGVDFPYLLGDLASIFTSEWGPIYYLDFFEWQVEAISTLCVGNVAEYRIETDFTSSIISQDYGVKLFPNPVSDVLFIESDVQINSASLASVSGKELLYKAIEDTHGTLKIKDIPNGVYILKLKSDSKTFVSSIVIH